MSIPSPMPAWYFEIRFRTAVVAAAWPAEFVILSGYATTGEEWPPERNEAADRELEQALCTASPWVVRITGYAPSSGHAEPGWGAVLPLAAACDLGLRFLQDAIYHVKGDELSVVKCAEPRELVAVGGFRGRVGA